MCGCVKVRTCKFYHQLFIAANCLLFVLIIRDHGSDLLYRWSSTTPFIGFFLHVLSFFLASLDSLLRDTTHWLPANTHSSGYDNHFDPSFRRSTTRKGIKERANASITQKLYITCMKLHTKTCSPSYMMMYMLRNF